MALTRTLVQWLLQSRHPFSAAPSTADARETHRGAFSSLVPAGSRILTSFLQSQFGLHSMSVADDNTASSTSRAVSAPLAVTSQHDALMTSDDDQSVSAATGQSLTGSAVEHRVMPPRDDPRDCLAPRFASFTPNSSLVIDVQAAMHDSLFFLQ